MKTADILKAMGLAALVMVPSSAAADNQMPNGSFEMNFSAWEAGGNVSLQSASPYGPTDGRWLAAFNCLNTTPNGYLITAAETVPGRSYRLEFDVGNVSYNSLHQRLQVIVEDNAPVPAPPGARLPYINDTIDIAGPGGGATAWVAASYELTPQEGFVRLTFKDVSPSTVSVDLVLDHIRLTPIPIVTNGGFENDLAGWSPSGNLLVQSGPPYLPVEGKKLLAFNAENRTANGAIQQTIPLKAGHHYRLEFQVGNLSFNALHQRLEVSLWTIWGYKQWSKVFDTIDIPGPGGGATAWVAASYEFTSSGHFGSLSFKDVSRATNSLDLVLDDVRITEIVYDELVANGGFENGLTGWDYYSLSNIKVQSSPPYNPTEGTSLLSFNDNNRPPLANLTQTLPVVPGKQYKVEFDIGNLAYNKSSQRMMVTTGGQSQTLDLPAPKVPGTIRWSHQRFFFTPGCDTVVLVFDDLSKSTLAVDMVLDNVSVILVP